MNGRTMKTNHQTGYHKPVVNPSTNYEADDHKVFCRRCRVYNNGICPLTGKVCPDKNCNI